MVTSGEKAIIVAAIIFVLYFYYTTQTKRFLSQAAGTIGKSVKKAAKTAEMVMPTRAPFSQSLNTLPAIPTTHQTGPPDFLVAGANAAMEHFAQEDNEACKQNPSLCQKFTQEGDMMTTVPPVSSSCPTFSDQIKAARFRPQLTGDNEAMTILGDENPYHEAVSQDKSYEWETNFQNDVQSAQLITSIENDPTRKFVSTPPQATQNSSIRADEKIAYDPAAACILSSSLTLLQSNQGL